MKDQLSNFVFQPGVVKPESENDDELLFLFYRDKLLFRVLKGEITIPSRKDVRGAGVNILRSQYLGALNGQTAIPPKRQA